MEREKKKLPLLGRNANTMWQILVDCSKPGLLGALGDHLQMCDSMTRNISPTAQKNWVGPLMMNSYKEAEVEVKN